ncbi:MAG TPA: hypothetical protein VHE11_02385, partial [Steroidobacteraceae bacterium]|nr:hypothetical protein [Steroidobacteraceae bacterium]
DVVRGADLMESTGWQIALQRALGLPVPRHAHLPLLLERTGGKLAKSRRSAPLDPASAGETLVRVLGLLGLPPPGELHGQGPEVMLGWAAGCWSQQPARLPKEIVLD